MEQALGRYRVLEEIGRGGMGVVFRARDTVLERLVALKTLPAECVSDPERRQQFLKEAQAASALNHPGIVTIHDLVVEDGQVFIVMELVEGTTLEERVARGPMPLQPALRVAIPVAVALARAHGAGIVHRDLKPSNVMVTKEGAAKVLDFGLAKLTQAAPHDTAVPTMPMRGGDGPGSEGGAVMGTVPYMSPEQTMAKGLDARTDVFSFGVLLYEMTTGRHPFRHPMLVETLSAIRTADPVPPTTHVPALPAEVERLILRCLQKEPTRRWQSMADLKVVLEDLLEDSTSGRKGAVAGAGAAGAAAAAGRQWSWRRRWGWLAASVTLVAAVAAAVFFLARRGGGAGGPAQTRRLTYDSGLTFSSSLSADGNLAVYSSDRGGDGPLSLWVQHLNQKNPVRLTREGADAWLPSLAPDGSRVVFRSERDGGGIDVVPTLGGEVRRLTAKGTFPKVSPDGKSVAYLERAAYAPGWLVKIFVVSLDGGSPRQVAPDYGSYDMPGAVGVAWSPDSRRLLFKGAPLAAPDKVDWWVAPVDGGPVVSSGAALRIPKTDIVQTPSAWLDGSVLFIAGTTLEGLNLYRACITPEGIVSAPVDALTSGPGMTMEASVSSTGLVSYSRFHWIVNLWSVGLDGASGRADGPPTRLTSGAEPKVGFSLSRDGSRLAFSSYSGSPKARRSEIRLRAMDTGRETVPVEGPTRLLNSLPRLSRDGSRMAWVDQVEGKVASLWGVPGEAGREICRGCSVASFTRDGSRVLVRQAGKRVSLVSLDGGGETLLFDVAAGAIVDADLSPDDRWVALHLGRPDRTAEIVVRAAEGTGSREIPVAKADSWLGAPRWSEDGRFLYYLSQRDGNLCVWAQALDAATKEPAGEPFAVVHAHGDPLRLNGPRGFFSLSVGRGRLVLNAVEGRGDVYLLDLPK